MTDKGQKISLIIDKVILSVKYIFNEPKIMPMFISEIILYNKGREISPMIIGEVWN